MHKHLFDAKPFKKNYLLDGLADETEECAQFEELSLRIRSMCRFSASARTGISVLTSRAHLLIPVPRKWHYGNPRLIPNKRYFADEKDVPRFAYSMGIQSILSSRKIILMAFGKEKAAAVKAALEGPITEDLPASILQTHKHVTVILDEAAAQMLSKK